MSDDDQQTLFPVFDPKPRGAYGDRDRQPSSQMTELAGETWEDAFGCTPDDIDESAGLKDDA